MSKSFNATPEGQKQMFYASSAVATVLILNSKVKQLGGSAWEAKEIEQANDIFLAAIKKELLEEYNRLVKLNQ